MDLELRLFMIQTIAQRRQLSGLAHADEEREEQYLTSKMAGPPEKLAMAYAGAYLQSFLDLPEEMQEEVKAEARKMKLAYLEKMRS